MKYLAPKPVNTLFIAQFSTTALNISSSSDGLNPVSSETIPATSVIRDNEYNIYYVK